MKTDAPKLDRLPGRPNDDGLARDYRKVAPEDPHFGMGETTDDDDLAETGRRERADLWDRIADSFAGQGRS